MPVVAVVDGVKIVFYANDHPPPHFHALFGDHAAIIDIESLTVVAGSLPIARKRRVLQWASTRRLVLTNRFQAAVGLKRVEPIE